MSNTYLIFDTETTGLMAGVHEIYQLAALAVRDGKEIGRIEIMMQPKRMNKVDPEALKVNRMTTERLMALPKRSIGKKALVKWLKSIGNCIPTGQNISFDIRHLKALIGEAVYSEIFTEDALDLMNITRALNKHGYITVERLKLANIIKYYGIECDHSKLHDAMQDVIMTKECLSRAMRDLVRISREDPKSKIFNDKNILKVIKLIK